MNSLGSASDASVIRRAPPAERSSMRHDPKADPSAPAILAPLFTDRRVLFRYSGRINHPANLDLCNAGGEDALGVAASLEAVCRTCQNRRTRLALFWDNL